MPAAKRYLISIADISASRGSIEQLSFHGDSPEFLARAFETALREPSLWERWRNLQDDPEAVDPTTGVIDPSATVNGSLEAQRSELVVITSLPHAIIKHRLDLLIGQHWKLRDVS
ncbi:MAG: hypothetical protein EYC71_02770 [Gammaproteobacteria bacterium]|nr:MAG: hypothetical protein EYC71_02770 [Gammaproteobacteria bacterium]